MEFPVSYYCSLYNEYTRHSQMFFYQVLMFWSRHWFPILQFHLGLYIVCVKFLIMQMLLWFFVSSGIENYILLATEPDCLNWQWTYIHICTCFSASLCSIGWLRLLHHCVTQCEDLQKEVTEAAVSTPDLLVTCTTLLMTSSAVIYANSIESVLLTIGLHSTEMGLGLLDQLLRNPCLGRVDDGMHVLPFGVSCFCC